MSHNVQEYQRMPSSVVATELIDLLLKMEAIPDKLKAEIERGFFADTKNKWIRWL